MALAGIGGAFAFANAKHIPSLVSRVKTSVVSILQASRAGDLASVKEVSAEEEAKLQTADKDENPITAVRPALAVESRIPAAPTPTETDAAPTPLFVPPVFSNNPVVTPSVPVSAEPNLLPRFSYGEPVRSAASAADTISPTVYETQFILTDFVSSSPRTACTDGSQTTLPATSVLLRDMSALFAQLADTPCTWFSATGSISSVIASLNSDFDGLSFVSRARATDGAGNTSDWTYSESITLEFEGETQSPSGGVVISEIAWMGTAASPNDEWLELFNTGAASTSLTQWQLVWGAFNTTTGRYERAIDLSGLTIGPYQTLVLERTNDTTISDRLADKIYTGALGNGGEHLRLLNNSGVAVDEVNALAGWFAGSNSAKETMSRRDFFSSGNLPASWCTFLSCPSDGLFATPQSGRDANNNPLNGSPARPRVE